MANAKFHIDHIDTILHKNMKINSQVDLNNIFSDHFR